MEEVLKFFALGCVQGLTEFLPVSSSGHLVLAGEVLGVRFFSVAVPVLLHLASIMAVCVAMRREIGQILKCERRVILLLVMGTIPSGVLYLAIGERIEALFDSVPVVLVSLGVTGVVFLFIERFSRPSREFRELNVLEATGIGVAQAVAMVPGISRSGMTVSAGLGLGVSRAGAVQFAFLLSIPAIGGGAVVKLSSPSELLSAGPTLALIVGFLASLGSSYLAIRILLRVVVKGKLWGFGVYCIVVAVTFGLLYYTGG